MPHCTTTVAMSDALLSSFAGHYLNPNQKEKGKGGRPEGEGAGDGARQHPSRRPSTAIAQVVVGRLCAPKPGTGRGSTQAGAGALGILLKICVRIFMEFP